MGMKQKYVEDSQVLGCPKCDFEAPEERFPHLMAGSFPPLGFECVWESLPKVRCPGCAEIFNEDDLEEVME